MTVQVRDGKLDYALKRLKRDVSSDLSVVRSKKEYKKKGVRLREEKKINTINCRKNQRNQNRRSA